MYHSIDTASFFSVLIAALIFSLSLAGVAAAQGNTSLGIGALQNNTTGSFNTATGKDDDACGSRPLPADHQASVANVVAVFHGRRCTGIR
jgi:hypothetical protein